jgi:hypothetical protein
MATREAELRAGLEHRFAAAEVPIAASELSKLAEAMAIVVGVGLGIEPALRDFTYMFPEVSALLGAEWREQRKTIADPAAVAAWDAAALEAAASGLPAPPLPDDVRRAWAYETWDGERWPKAALEPYGWYGFPVDDKGCALVPPGVHDELVLVLGAEAEQFDWKSVVESAWEHGLTEAAEWIEDYPGNYLLGVYQGFESGYDFY